MKKQNIVEENCLEISKQAVKEEKRNFIARLVIYNISKMKTKDYKRLLAWLEARFEEAQRSNYRKEYADKYVSKLMK